jgi:hypothetical protein
MSVLLRANILADFAFYRRSRLLLAFAVLCLLLTGLSSLPAIFSDSGVQSFRSLQGIFSELNGMLLFLAGAIGLFVISSHLRSRCLKMVFTKPCPPSVWLGSAFLSAVFISLFLNSAILGGTVILSLIWHLPVRAALVFVSADNFIVSIGIIAYMMLLATLLHPALAVTFILIFNAEMFYDFQVWAQGAIRAGNSSFYLRLLERLFHFFYLLLPMVNPYGKETENVHSSMRVAHAEWKYIVYSFGYVLTLSAFCYFLALFALQKKRHI